MTSVKIIGTVCIFLAFSASSCRMTDKNESNAIGTDIINNTHSGYDADSPENLPQLVFEKDQIDFGDISQGKQVKLAFDFKNEGKTALVINSVKAGCGCTVIDNWPRQPVMPGGSGTIHVEFNSENKEGKQTKSVTIISNTSPSSTIVTLTGNVITPEGI